MRKLFHIVVNRFMRSEAEKNPLFCCTSYLSHNRFSLSIVEQSVLLPIKLQYYLCIVQRNKILHTGNSTLCSRI